MRKAAFLTLLVTALVAAAAPAAPAAAQIGSEPASQAGTGVSPIVPVAPVGLIAPPKFLPVSVAPEGPYVVVLAGESMSSIWTTTVDEQGRTVPEVDADVRRVRDAARELQADVESRLTAQGGEVISRYEALFNGMLVTAPPGGAEALRRIPGVDKVYRAPVFDITLEDSVPYIGTDRVMEELGVDGTGVNVAIIDTGIDYYHGAFGGSGDAADYKNDDPDIVEEGSFPTAKVVGGYDFVGTKYSPRCGIPERTAGLCSPNPRPDDDPKDEQGHGTHVGSISAGLATDDVYHGVAPGASVIGLKVYGASAAGTNLVTDALEWAVKARAGEEVPGTPARVDVINMSLGTLYALSLFEEQDIVRKVVDAGIVVVSAAGNDGDRPFILGSPAASEASLAVASSFAPGEDALGVTARWEWDDEPQERLMEAQEGGFTKSIEDNGPVTDEVVWMGRGCNGDPVHTEPEGKFALIERGVCTFQEKLDNAADLGATGAVVFSDDRPPTVMGGDTNLDIYGVMIGRPDGLFLRDELLLKGTAVTMELDASVRIPHPELADAISDFSSRGPSRLGSLKPDITAPGSNIQAAAVGGGNAGVKFGGTSMASPHVAGAAALVLEHFGDKYIPGLAQPGDNGFLDAYDVSRMLAVTANPETFTTDSDTGDLAPVARQGNGRVDVYHAVKSKTLIRAGTLAGLNFGYRPVAEDLRDERAMQIVNLGDRPQYYKVTPRFADGAGSLTSPAVSVRSMLEDAVIRVDPRDQVTLYVTLEVDVEELGKTQHVTRGGDPVGNGVEIAKSEAFGYVEVNQVDKFGQPVPDGDSTHVHFYAMPEAVSNVASETESLAFSARGTRGAQNVALANTGPGLGEVEAFTWVGADARESTVPGSIDVTNVGVRTTTDPDVGRVVEFAIDISGTYQVPTQVAYYVYVDTNNNGTYDWVVLGIDPGLFLGSGITGQFLTFAVPAPNGQPNFDAGIPEFWGDVRLNGSYAILPISAERLGLTGKNPRIQFFAAAQDTFGIGNLEGFDVAPGGVSTSASPTALWSFDLDNQPVAAVPSHFQVGGEGHTFKAVANPRPGGPQASGLMLVYPFNRQGGAPDLEDDTEVIPANLRNVPENPIEMIYMPALHRPETQQ